MRLHTLRPARVTRGSGHDHASAATHPVLALQRIIGNQAVGRMSSVLQRVFLLSGTKVDAEMLDYPLPGINPQVRLVSYTKRHTIKGFVNAGTTKALNTVLTKQVEMTRVAAAAYGVAWNNVAGRLNVAD